MFKIFIILACFTLPFVATALGSALIWLAKHPSSASNTLATGFSGGVMLSASIWSLLLPSITYSKTINPKNFLTPVLLGLLFGILFMFFIIFLSKFANRRNFSKIGYENFLLAITIHNIPEGLIVGISVGFALNLTNFTSNLPVFYTNFATNLAHSVILATGIALQNIPEGFATALTIEKFTTNKKKSFYLSLLGGIVEPAFASVGFFLASNLILIFPATLSFAAGAMFFIVFFNFLPEIFRRPSFFAIFYFFFGFLCMSLLDLLF